MQTVHSATSNLDLHCLSMSLFLTVKSKKREKQKIEILLLLCDWHFKFKLKSVLLKENSSGCLSLSGTELLPIDCVIFFSNSVF